MIDAYFGRYPNISAYIESAKDFVKEHGYVKTLMGEEDICLTSNPVIGMHEHFLKEQQ